MEIKHNILYFLASSSPIQTVTVGFGFSPNQLLYDIVGHGLYRRSGISPCPENGIDMLLYLYYKTLPSKLQDL